MKQPTYLRPTSNDQLTVSNTLVRETLRASTKVIYPVCFRRSKQRPSSDTDPTDVGPGCCSKTAGHGYDDDDELWRPSPPVTGTSPKKNPFESTIESHLHAAVAFYCRARTRRTDVTENVSVHACARDRWPSGSPFNSRSYRDNWPIIDCRELAECRRRGKLDRRDRVENHYC